MDGKYNDVEQLFIKEILQEHGQFLQGLLVNGIHKFTNKENSKSVGALCESISYKVEKRGNNFVLSFGFLDYGRFLEIQYFRSKNSQKMRAISDNTLAAFMRRRTVRDIERKKKSKVDTRWYSKNVFGSQNRLIGRAGSGLMEDEIMRLKAMLSEAKANGTYAQILLR